MPQTVGHQVWKQGLPILETHNCARAHDIHSISQRLDRKLTTFGVDFLKHLKMSKRNIPIIVTKCIKEIEERGLETHGLYRISTTKTKLEHLCQLFESGADRVDLSDCPPHLIASCLKLYFRQVCSLRSEFCAVYCTLTLCIYFVSVSWLILCMTSTGTLPPLVA